MNAGVIGVCPVAVPSAARDLLRRCEEGVRAAARIEAPAERYCAAHLAAIRAAAAVLAVRGRPRPRGPGAFNVWQVLARVAPELTEWAELFASGAARRSAAQAGLPAVVNAREADDLVRQTMLFAAVVAEHLGLPPAAATEPEPPRQRLPAVAPCRPGPARRAQPGNPAATRPVRGARRG